ncbi:transposase [Bradyrhizobium niftali]|uniref:Transposase n=1 Tax=Bradyrhizobium niftali TaxID=2560055 RepID=A0A4Y9LQW6_9BRAD|nr:transposase [Bradyrhizobium niftali]
MTTVTVLSGPERRRRWTTAEKLRIVEESLAPGASVVEVARRHDVHRNLVTAWRRQARTGILACGPGRCSGRMTRSVLRRSPLRQTGNR